MGLRDKAKNVKIVEDKNIYLVQTDKGLELCANIISLGDNKFKSKLAEFDTIIADFIEISSKDENQVSAISYAKLQEIKNDIVNISNFPKLENHYTVAVGGGFSAGKSTFFNKVLGLKDVLPTDTNPSTSISAYIVKEEKNKFLALNEFGNIITLDKEAIGAISHAFNKKYNISFSHILKLLLIEQQNLRYENTVFLDTPGYSKSDDIGDGDNIDENIAREHLRNTDFLIWLVDCQTPISDVDMKFIKTLDLKHPMLVVLNKADKRTQKDLDMIVKKTKENLIEKNIPLFDVVAYSSSKDIEYSKTQNIIKTYLSIIDKSTTGTKILKNLKDLFKQYIEYYDSQLQENRIVRKTLNEMLMKEAVDVDYLEDISSLSSKFVKQNKEIESFKKGISLLQSKAELLLSDILKDCRVNVIDFKQKYVFSEEYYSKQKSVKKEREVYRFDAILQIKDEKEFLKFKDLKNIEARVHKISSLGVFFRINGVNGDLMVTKRNIEKSTNGLKIADAFQKDDTVKVQITKNKKAIVIKE